MRSGQVDESHLANIMKKYIWLFGENLHWRYKKYTTNL